MLPPIIKSNIVEVKAGAGDEGGDYDEAAPVAAPAK